jgi:hypothetical protein
MGQTGINPGFQRVIFVVLGRRTRRWQTKK